jgi:hypothetical protein
LRPLDKSYFPGNTLAVYQKAFFAGLIVYWLLAGLGQPRNNLTDAENPPLAQTSIATVPFDGQSVLGLPAPKVEGLTASIAHHLGGFYPSAARELNRKPIHELDTANNGAKLYKRICVFLI